MFFDPFRARRNQSSLLIIAEQDKPIGDRTWPFTIRQKVFWLCAERTHQSRYISVTPAEENHFPLLVRTQVSGQFNGLTVAKAGIDWQFCRFCERFDRETRAMALL